jgi:hypothetical protein
VNFFHILWGGGEGRRHVGDTKKGSIYLSTCFNLRTTGNNFDENFIFENFTETYGQISVIAKAIMII